jgi:hypothetical protein
VCSAIDFVEPLVLNLMGQFDGNILLLNESGSRIDFARKMCHPLCHPGIENQRIRDYC